MILIRPPRIKCKSRLVYGVASVEVKIPALCQLMTSIKSLPLHLPAFRWKCAEAGSFLPGAMAAALAERSHRHGYPSW